MRVWTIGRGARAGVIATGLLLGSLAWSSPALAATPTVISVSPATGPASGGTAVTITGSNFTSGTPVSVFFGGVAASAIVVIDDTTLTANAPAFGSAGSTFVEVYVGASGGGLFNAYTYYGPAARISLIGASSDLASGASRTLTATVEDAAGTTVDDSSGTMQFQQVSGTGTVTGLGSAPIVSGIATLTVTGGGAGDAGIVASSPGLVDSGAVTFQVIAGPPSVATSTIAVAPSSIAADGSSTATVTVALRDDSDNPLGSGGATVVVAATSGSVGPTADAGDGTYTATLVSPAAPGTATVTATVDAAMLDDTATIEFTAVIPPVPPVPPSPPAPPPPPPTTVPGAPRSPSATPTWQGADLTWLAPEFSGGAPVLGYRIEAMTDDTPWTILVPSTRDSATSWLLADLAGGLGYSFRIRAINAVGVGAASEPTAMVVPWSPSIEGSATRERRRVTVAGMALGLDDSVAAQGLVAHVCAGPCTQFVPRRRTVALDATGAFTWHRRSNGGFLVYFTAANGLASEVISVSPRRAPTG